jgi:hypothetical protein
VKTILPKEYINNNLETLTFDRNSDEAVCV